MSDDYLKHAEAVIRRLESKEKPEVSISTLLSVENIQRIQFHIFLIGVVTAVLSITFFALLMRNSGSKNYEKLKKMWYAPRTALAFACGSSLWLLGHAALTVVSLLIRSDFSTHWYPLSFLAINYFLVSCAVICIALGLDFEYSSSALLGLIFTTFLNAATDTPLAGSLGMWNLGTSIYWTMALARAYFKKEMKNAMKEIQDWQAPMKEKDAKRAARLAKRSK